MLVNKIMTTGRGGVLVGAAEHMQRARSLAAHARVIGAALEVLVPG